MGSKIDLWGKFSTSYNNRSNGRLRDKIKEVNKINATILLSMIDGYQSSLPIITESFLRKLRHEATVPETKV